MTTTDQDAGTAEKSGGSIGFLRAAEKMQISTFEIPLIFLEDIGFSKDRIGAAKEMNRKFVSGFYGRLRSIGDKFGRGDKSPPKVPAEKKAARKVEAKEAVKPAKQEAVSKDKAAKAVKQAAVSKDKAAKAAKKADTKTPAKKASTA